MARVSIVMPVHNTERYVGEAIASVLQQTLSDWELLVIDDGSTDDSVSVVRSFEDPRIRLICQEQSGAGAARNRGLEAARGEYLAFLDADDLYVPAALEWNARFLDAYPECGVVYTDGNYVDEAGRPLAALSAHRPSQPTGNVLDAIAVMSFIGPPCSVMVRRSAIERRKLRFELDRPAVEDWEFFIHLAEDEAFGFNPEMLCGYRIHGRNITLAQPPQRIASFAKVRMALLHSPTYWRLSTATQSTLLYQLLFEHCSDDPAGQEALLGSPRLAALPSTERARLQRLTAAHWLLKGWSHTRALYWLEMSGLDGPVDVKTRLLGLGARLSPAVTRALVGGWRWLGGRVRRKGERGPFQLALRTIQ